MKARSILANGAILLAFPSSAAYPAGPIKIIKVAVTCSGDDLPGKQVCFELKEKIRASEGFELVTVDDAERSDLGFGAYLISMDVDAASPNNASAISVAFTVPMPGKQFDYYVNHALLLCGASKVDEIATTILSYIEDTSEFLRNPQGHH
jgi:hypothetical protein